MQLLDLPALWRALGLLSKKRRHLRASAAGDPHLHWDDRSLAFHSCRQCGCVTHWWPAADWRDDRMGINARLMEASVAAGAKRRFLDGAISERYIDE
ncbi:hypothetical protein GCM10010862_07570 [Devosia nitrariae]|uniref:Uncharacterized protein n=1 Tax=Devosia nitrariae TaxID=2071872 RepID=A0ABQ5W1A8_9HYPH|nr:hypothetical protein GCM10010862_07570 [Devosia nitrariae]